MHQMKKKCFCDPICGEQLRMIAIVVQMFFLYEVKLVLFSTKLEKMQRI